jgi:hypothetical protein
VSWLAVLGLLVTLMLTMKIFSKFMHSSRTWSDCFIDNIQMFCVMGKRMEYFIKNNKKTDMTRNHVDHEIYP